MASHKSAEVHAKEDRGGYHGQSQDYNLVEKNATTADVQDMQRMGKTQETRRNFRSFTILGFCIVLLSTWEAILATSVFALSNGGTAGLIWGYLIVMVGFGFVVASLAEMASMAPTSGGQYHWVSEFAPPSCQRFLSYLVGWLGVLGWQTAAATVSYLAGKQIQGLIILNDPSYNPKAWHGTLLIWAILAVCLIFNTFLSRYLPLVEGGVVILHVVGFFAVIIPLWVMSDRTHSSSEIFSVFQDNMMWGNLPFAVILGLTSATSTFVGVEAGAHMAEEVRDAAHVIPRAMMWTWLGNGLLGWVMAITFCFCVTDTISVLTTPLGTPFIQVSPKREVPVNSAYITLVFVVILSFINLGSTVAFMQVVSLGVASMLTSYMISISCIALKRIRGEPLLPSKFDLGRLGLPINIIAVLFLFFAWVFCFFPVGPRPTVADMNWAVLGYGIVILFAIFYYVLRGRHVYAGPVKYVRSV
ncbi:unnamed protein product [Alternaria alternata]